MAIPLARYHHHPVSVTTKMRLYKRGLVFSTIRGFLVTTFLFLIWKFAWLDLLGSYFEKWSRFVRTTTLTWTSTTWTPSMRCWSPSWTNSDSGHTHYWPSIQSNASGNGPKWFLVPKYLGFDTKIKSVACPEVELLHHEEVRSAASSGRVAMLMLSYAQNETIFQSMIPKDPTMQIFSS